jgi:hypothetical protein
MSVESILASQFKDVQDSLSSLGREYKRLKKIEILLQQYLFECEEGYGGKIGERIKETIERKLERMKATNEDRLLALYHLEEPHKDFMSTKKLIQHYERIANVESAREQLEGIRLYEQYCREKRAIRLPALDRFTS